VEFKDSEQVREFARKKFNLDELPDFTFVEPVGPSGAAGKEAPPPKGGPGDVKPDKELPSGGADDEKDGTQK
jgi:hypothetical protein